MLDEVVADLMHQPIDEHEIRQRSARPLDPGDRGT
jgi:hypothetical protein